MCSAAPFDVCSGKRLPMYQKQEPRMAANLRQHPATKVWDADKLCVNPSSRKLLKYLSRGSFILAFADEIVQIQAMTVAEADQRLADCCEAGCCFMMTQAYKASC